MLIYYMCPKKMYTHHELTTINYLPFICDHHVRLACSSVSISSQRRQLRVSLGNPSKLTLKAGDEWYVISLEWIKRWKRYVDFDSLESGSIEAGRDPGEIDNRMLQHPDNERQLREDVQEGKDFICLPKDDYEMLKNIFGGGPHFKRSVVQVKDGNLNASLYSQIDLYPFEVDVYFCDNFNGKPDLNPTKTINLSRNATLRDLCKTVTCVGTSVTSHSEVRIWLKLNKREEFSSWFGDQYRDITTTFTRTDQPECNSSGPAWYCLSMESSSSSIVSDFASPVIQNSSKRFSILVEKKPKVSIQSQRKDFPRQKILNSWVNRLQKNDVLDICVSGIWTEGVVTAVNDSFISARPLGSNRDSDINFRPQIGISVDTLYTCSKNWRALIKENDRVEVLVGDKERWQEAVVKSVDIKSGTIDAVVESKNTSSPPQPTKPLVPSSIESEMSVCKVHTLRLYSEQVGKYGGWNSGNVEFKKPKYTLGSYRAISPIDMIDYGDVNRDRYSSLHSKPPSPPAITTATATATATTSVITYNDRNIHNQSNSHLNRTASNSCGIPSHRYGYGSSSSYPSSSSSSSYSSLSNIWVTQHVRGEPLGGCNGTTGLENLGNTCFMNSMLQCMSNYFEFSEYFIRNCYKDEVNRHSKHSHGGRLVEKYAELIKDLWCGQYSKCAPVEFKKIIGEICPQFAGYQQHDSQEFMQFLLDGLHEDLNRVRDKPYVEPRECGNREDSIVAIESWENNKLREDSIVTDKFFGQLKSHTTCVGCGHVSVTFDPFECLSLPIPIKNTVTVDFFQVPLPYGSELFVASVELSEDANVAQFIEELNRSQGTNKCYQVAVFSSYFRRNEGDLDLCANVRKESMGMDLYVFEVLPCTRNVYKANNKQYSSSLMSTVTQRASIYQGDSDGDKYSHQNGAASSDSHISKSYVAVDVIMREQATSDHYCSSHVAIGNPFRLCLPASKSTVDDARRAVEQLLKEFTSNTTSTDMLPYKLCLSSASNSEKSTLSLNELDGDEVLSLEGGVTLFVEWLSSYIRNIPRHLLEKPVKRRKARFDANEASITLNSCIKKFIECEKMNDSETVYCSKCKQHLAPIKKLDLWRTPDVLIISLKRFTYQPGMCSVRREKICDFVDFPIDNLDLGEYIVGPHGQDPTVSNIYDLYAVSQHSGTLGGGHYTAIAQNHFDKNWYMYNDGCVRLADKKEIVTSAAYVLFYKRRKL